MDAYFFLRCGAQIFCDQKTTLEFSKIGSNGMRLQPRVYVLGIFAIIASLATLPYGYRFARILTQISFLKIILGIFFAVCAGSANAILGTYSLLKLDKKTICANLYLVLVGILGAIPQGIISYFGYRETFPLYVNLIASSIVTLVNAAINCTALNNLKQSAQALFFSERHLSTNEIAFRSIGALMGMMVSMLGYLAAANGLVHLFHFYNFYDDWIYTASYLLSVLTWIPYMALFVNATQATAAKVSKSFISFGMIIESIQIRDAFLLIYIFASGGAFGQIMLDFLNPANAIPSVFKTAPIQALAFPFLMPLAFLASSALNYFALQEVIAIPKNKIFNSRTAK